MRSIVVSWFPRGGAASFIAILATSILLASGSVNLASAAPVDRVEQLLDVLVTANFNGDFAGAGQALTAVVEFERANGIEPSGRMAVIQVRETQAFADRLQARIQGYIDSGFPILASLEIAAYGDVLRFEPSGAARVRTMSAMVDAAGAVLCDQLNAEAATRPGIRDIANGVCAGFGRLVAEPVSAGYARTRSAGLVPAPVGVIAVSGDVRGFADMAVLGGALDRTVKAGALVGQGGTLALAVTLSGNAVSSIAGGPGQFPFQYAVEVPYAEMEEYCQWVEEVKLETVVEGAITRTVKRTTRTCNKSQRPVDKVRVEPRTLMLDGTAWKQTVIWQYRVTFDDGDGCTGARAFDGRETYNDFEHNLSDPAIGLAPDPKSPVAPDAFAVDVAGRIAGWLVETESNCLRRRWCDRPAGGGPIDLETALRCAALPGSDPRAVDSAIGVRFGVSVAELLRFMGRVNQD